ncbi:hypothetical protein GA0115240_12622 [Streptomyces sp. DvalAA-14]|uniref:hypothetical protein n=1 Tax=unclassified Streptomyces TaxID=2593676 RepID=UPI00081B3E54|nr:MULTISPECIES: hypothetical protein [unclassified Streptomyces]MYS21137.1 hypothetical protein [Streptomyces sp. SID4948]SCD85151.1 hypothetical protein GA0115240_12622 [Streptomyces sp. DvalAA-14]
MTVLPTRWHFVRAHRFLSSALALVVLAAVGVGGVWAYGALFPPALSCGAGLTLVGKPLSCVGVNLDGSRMRKDEPAAMRRLVAQVKAADDQVSGPYESVALLLDLTPVEGVDTDSYASLYPNIEGAVSAQWQANHTATYGTKPAVKLFLANLGSGNNGWQEAVRQITAHTADHHIDEVIGLGQSTIQTRRAAKALTAAHLSVIGATVTADTMNADPDTGKPMKGFYRLSYTNTDAVAAAAQFLDARPSPPAKVLIVRDTVGGDDYVRTLGADADKGLKARGRTLADLTYSSPDTAVQGRQRQTDLLNVFGQRHAAICQADPRAIFFAGRGSDLGAFLQSLDQAGPCRLGNPVVLTGDDGAEGIDDPAVIAAADHGTPIYFTALASPDEWDRASCESGVRTDFEVFKAAFTGKPDTCTHQTVEQDGPRAAPLAFPARDLDNGQAMLTHDAAAAAFRAARDGVTPGTDQTVRPDTLNALSSYVCPSMLPGAGGWIAFGAQGNPVDAAIPLVRIGPGGKVGTQGVIWAKHTPMEELPKLGQPVPGC